MSDLTSYRCEDGIATIKMDDGKVNALGVPMLRELHGALERAERDDAIVILTGREGRFSAGFDLKVFSDAPEQIAEMLTLGATLCERILTFPRPFVTACTGHGVAAGCFIQLPADLRLGADGPFRIGLNEVRIGLTMPRFVIELARSRLTPAEFDRAVNSAAMYAPADAGASRLPRPGRPRRGAAREGQGGGGGARRARSRGPQADQAEVTAGADRRRPGRHRGGVRGVRLRIRRFVRQGREFNERRAAELEVSNRARLRSTSGGLQKGAEVRHRGGVLDEKQVSALITPQL